MTYRPQFVYPAPPAGFEDEQFHYSFDSTNTPALANSLPAGAYANDIPLLLQSDAPFIARAIKIQLGAAHSTLWFELKTPHGDYIALPYVPISRYAGEGDGAAIAGRLFVPIEEAIYCPSGSSWVLYLYNPTLASVNPPALTLFGCKRRDCRRAA